MKSTVPSKKVHRFIVDQAPGGGRLRITDGALAHQIRDVLKLRVGESLTLVSGGREHLCRVAGFDRGGVDVEPTGSAAAGRDPDVQAALYCAVVKKENFELVVQKATEIGVAEIVPVISRRTVKLNVRMERLAAIAREAAEQCGRLSPPLIREPLALARAMELAAGNGRNWFFDPSGAALSAAELKGPGGNGRLGLFIGPEGGWDAAEIAAAVRAGCRVAALGRLILRAETAAIAAAYLACWPPAV